MKTGILWVLFVVMVTSISLLTYLTSHKPGGRRIQFPKFITQNVDLSRHTSFSQIIPNLYLGNARAAADRDVLRLLNISHVLTIETRKVPKSTFKDFNIKTLYIRAYDTADTNILPYFPMAYSFIKKGLKEGNVLVHCHFGISRSATIVISYLMKDFQLTYDEAYAFVKMKRNFINPNQGFVEQLRYYEEMGYDVKRCPRLKAYVTVKTRKHMTPIVVGTTAVTLSVIATVLILLI